MIETAKIHNLSPEDYLRCVFESAPYCETTADWKKLLPWNIEITPFQPRGQGNYMLLLAFNLHQLQKDWKIEFFVI
ncbi:MAG: transposase domain-containing protein [Spirochaetia bacterium]|nr:transposase domain-containing protein [Spirochaetia bacterium]